jgi:hypothetical protein
VPKKSNARWNGLKPEHHRTAAISAVNVQKRPIPTICLTFGEGRYVKAIQQWGSKRLSVLVRRNFRYGNSRQKAGLSGLLRAIVVMADSELDVAKAGCDNRAVESVVVQRYVIARHTGGDGMAVGKVVRSTGGGLCE